MKILVPVDGSKTTEKTLRAVLENRDRITAPMTLLHVAEVDKLAYRMIPDFQLEMICDHARRAGESLLRQKQQILAQGGMAADIRLETGSPREIIPRVANEEPFGLLIIGRRWQGEIRDVLFGSVTNHVLHHVRCPVLLI